MAFVLGAVVGAILGAVGILALIAWAFVRPYKREYLRK
jgi:hypothetical protein